MNTPTFSVIGGCCCPDFESQPPKHELIQAAQDVLQQALDLIRVANAHQYSQIAPPPFGASVGQHYRHVLEHFTCLIEGRAAGEINYDARRRNPRIEKEPSFATLETRQVMQGLEDWSEQTLDSACSTISSVAYDSQAPARLESNVARELSYCIGHAIHHYAIIRLICSQIGVVVPPEFGYAPSTLKHRSALATD